ncbi:MAG: hypothetical protein ABH886_08050 [Candidatus Desantisbacteria bacterium]
MGNRINDYNPDNEYNYIAEKPIVYTRKGDGEIYENDDIDDIDIKDVESYRSVHYVIKYNGYYIEVQVRTIFEDGWGEIDHNILYPYYVDAKLLKGFSTLLSRLTGMADEMSSYFKTISEYIKSHENGKSNTVLSKIENVNDEITQLESESSENTVPSISDNINIGGMVHQIIIEQ